MEAKDIILRALNHFLLYIQMGEHQDGKRRKNITNECISYIDNGGTVDRDWLISKNLFFVDVFNEYSQYLKNMIQDTIPNDVEISQIRAERTTTNILLNALKQHFGIE